MKCEICGGTTGVTNTAKTGNIIARTRTCSKCGHKIHTVEIRVDKADDNWMNAFRYKRNFY